MSDINYRQQWAEGEIEAGTLLDAIDALAQRCASLEAASVMPGFLANPIIDTLRAEVADLKARLLEAERGNEELVRLRAETRDLRALIAECAEYLNTNNLTSICHGSILHRKMMEAATEPKP